MSHINANHIIHINGHPFKANEDGMWNLTEIWKTLKLHRGKSPSEWRTKDAKRFSNRPQKMRVVYLGQFPAVMADKQVTLKYAGWVSPDFEDMVYAAFESILAMPEVQTVVVNKMVELGYHAEAELLERHSNADTIYAMRECNRLFSKADAQSPQRVYKAAKLGTISKDVALGLIPSTSVWSARVFRL